MTKSIGGKIKKLTYRFAKTVVRSADVDAAVSVVNIEEIQLVGSHLHAAVRQLFALQINQDFYHLIGFQWTTKCPFYHSSPGDSRHGVTRSDALHGHGVAFLRYDQAVPRGLGDLWRSPGEREIDQYS